MPCAALDLTTWGVNTTNAPTANAASVRGTINADKLSKPGLPAAPLIPPRP